MRLLLFIMTGIGFTLGLLFGLVLQLPSDTLPSDPQTGRGALGSRSRRDLGLEFPARAGLLSRDAGAPGHSTSIDSVKSPPNPELSSPSSRVNSPEAGPGERGGESAGAGRNLPSAEVQMKIPGGKQSAPDSGPVHNNPSPHAQGASQVKIQIRGGGGGGGGSHGGEGTPPAEEKNDEGYNVLSDAAPAVSVKIRVYNNASKPEQHPRAAKRSVKDEKMVSLKDAVNGIVWSSTLEASCPRDISPSDLEAWQAKTRSTPVVKVEDGCGRMQNRLLTLRDASLACARYRLNTDQLQGEIYSYYLARLLNMTANFPPSSLMHISVLDPQWRQVHLDLAQAQWADDRVVIVTQWVGNLSPAYIPEELREDSRSLHPEEKTLRARSQASWCELMQWSDLIVFDYLTANLDRVVNNMFNRQWNDQMMNSPTHNLERTPSGSLMFLDNESGLFHGYRLLDKYETYHRALLKSLCVFRASTVRAVRSLSRAGHVGEELHKLFSDSERLHHKLPRIPEKNIKVLKQRLKDVEDQIVKCERLYGR